MDQQLNDRTRDMVRARYGSTARMGGGCCGGGCGCGQDAPEHTLRLGYDSDEVAVAADVANSSLGCGNPQVIASLKDGETVLDLGSGAGFDCLLAARQVGPSGKVIGVDMTPEMLEAARENTRKAGFENVEFRMGEIERLPIEDASIDVILSNCVVNLSPDKRAVFSEAFRVLRPGGRVAISDVVAIKPLPEAVSQDNAAFCGCVGGAALVQDIEAMLEEVGFDAVSVKLTPGSAELIDSWFPGEGFGNYVRSAQITAVKAAKDEE